MSTATAPSIASTTATASITSAAAPAASAPSFKGQTYTEQVKEIEAVGGDPTFLEPPTTWDGSVDESAHFGGWEKGADSKPLAPKPEAVAALSYQERKKEIEAVGGDPTFLDDTPPSVWDGSINESAHVDE